MPRREQAQETNVQKAKAYVKSNGLRFDVAYHLMADALRADGKSPVLAPAGSETAIAEADLSADEQAQLAAARSALGF